MRSAAQIRALIARGQKVVQGLQVLSWVAGLVKGIRMHCLSLRLSEEICEI